MRLTFADVQRNVSEIANRESYGFDFVFDLLSAYGRAASAITKLRSGVNNLAPDKANEVLQRGVVYFKHVPESSKLHSTIDVLKQDPIVVRYNPRYLIATDYTRLVAMDTKKGSTLDIKLCDIDRNVDFFYGWTGDEVTSAKTEAVADRRAADKMQELYAEIERINLDKLADKTGNFRHNLNVFFSRLLFCFFAEDTRIFSKEEPAIFTNAIKDFTQTDGSDLDEFLRTLFDALDIEDKSGFTSPFSKFPYVNGTIFDTKKHSIGIPRFNAQARKLILDCGNQNWAEINPDIFGSMFQSIVDEEQRESHGQHYTSVPNIMKTIDPLFLDELREEFDKSYDSEQKLQHLWDRISAIKIFDPACGSGNFLIIAYKELRKIEHGIIERLYGDEHKRNMLAGRLTSRIKLDNFYGIEIDDFPHEIAILSLYLAKHQMNIDFEQQFGREIKLIPLKDNANIVLGNAAHLNWDEVCPNLPIDVNTSIQQQNMLIEIEAQQRELNFSRQEWNEIYLISNPPYEGARKQDTQQKKDMEIVLGHIPGYRDVDYIFIWYYLAAKYIRAHAKQKCAFVATNSVSQGQQVGIMWPTILGEDLEIGFAHLSFKWTNNAKNSAGVTCVIISLRNISSEDKFLFDHNVKMNASNINAYLVDAENVYVYKRRNPLSNLPEMNFGSMPNDNGNLLFTDEEHKCLTNEYPDSGLFFKKFVGADEYLDNSNRWCLWITDENLTAARDIPFIEDAIQKTRKYRAGSDRIATQKLAGVPYRFGEVRYKPTNSIIVPSVTSERRDYIPIGFLDKSSVISNLAFAIYDAQPWVFGLISSKMHMVWVRAVAGQLETRIRYSSAIVYNNFPLRPLLEHEKNELSERTRSVLFARENHSEKTLAQMYDPDKMPADLRQAHEELDLTVDRLYRSKPYNTDKERLADLFKLYEQMLEREKTE